MAHSKSKVRATLPARVEKVIQSHPSSREPEKAQIAVERADYLYREIRVPNVVADEEGNRTRLKEGAKVEVTIEADAKADESSSPSGNE